jgi:hypothetical protein
MYHLFFLSLLSFLLFWNEGHSTIASLPLSSSTKKGKPPLPPKSLAVERKASLLKKDAKKKKLLADPDSFTGAEWVHKQDIEGKGQTAVVMETQILEVRQGSKVTVIKKGFDSPEPGKKNHADSVIDSLLFIAPQARVVLIGSTFSIDDFSSLKKNQLNQIEQSLVINRSLGFATDYPDLLNKAKKNQSLLNQINRETKEDIENLRAFLNKGKSKLLVQAAGNEFISLSAPAMESGSDVLYSGIKTLSEDPYIHKHLIIASAIGQRFTDTMWSAYPGENKNLQDITLYTLGEDLDLLGAPGDLIDGTSYSAPIISGAILLLKQKYPTLTMIQIKESLLESADRTFAVEDKDHLKRVTFVYESDAEKPNLTPFKDKKNRARRRFNPELYGKGILNLRSAFLYAKLKIQNKHFGPRLLRQQMKRILKKQDDASATKIQAAFRGYHVRKRKLKAVRKG